jgi:hypothetical protein
MQEGKFSMCDDKDAFVLLNRESANLMSRRSKSTEMQNPGFIL